MKLSMVEDEKYPHVFVNSPQDPDYAAHHQRHERDVPDDLGIELLALRRREAELLDLIEKHIRSTGQRPVQEDWEPDS
jgi:hypothetical protein